MEKIKIFETQKSTSEIFENSSPKIIEKFTPNNAEEAKADFFENSNLDKPNNSYEKQHRN